MSDYQPIDCALHDELQLRALRRRPSELEWREADGTPRVGEGVCIDVFARGGVEYLKLADGTEIRLDHLVRVDEVEFPDAQRR